MAHGVSFGSYLAAAFLLAGLFATLLIRPARAAQPPPAETAPVAAAGRHRAG